MCLLDVFCKLTHLLQLCSFDPMFDGPKTVPLRINGGYSKISHLLFCGYEWLEYGGSSGPLAWRPLLTTAASLLLQLKGNAKSILKKWTSAHSTIFEENINVLYVSPAPHRVPAHQGCIFDQNHTNVTPVLKSSGIQLQCNNINTWRRSFRKKNGIIAGLTV